MAFHDVTQFHRCRDGREMSGGGEDRFTPRTGRIRGRGGKSGGSYLQRVLRAANRFGLRGRGGSSFAGSRLGRGAGAVAPMRRPAAGAPRRVAIKTRIVKLGGGRTGAGGGLAAAAAHVRYLQRDGVSKEHEPGRVYDAGRDDADGRAFVERGGGDRHQFRFIVSPEDAAELDDLKPFVRDLMRTMEKDLGTRLDWIAVDHFNTAHPHSHIVLRGKDDLGKDLVIARDYIAHGMRRRASELATLELGPRTGQEIRAGLERQIGQDRFTDLDRGLVRDAGDGLVDTRRDTRDADHRHAMRVGRLRVLEARGLAEETEPGRWRLSSDLEATLRRAGDRGDIVKTMHRGMREAGLDAGASEYAIHDPGDPNAAPVTGRIVDCGLHDELNDGHYVLVDAADGRVHYVALDPKQHMDDLPRGAVVEVGPGQSRPKLSDRNIVEVARSSGGLYSPELHRAHDPRASEAFVTAHVRRLEALRRSNNLVRRREDGMWEIPNEFTERVEKLARGQARYPRVAVLSFLSIESQVTAQGVTWLDRELVARERTGLRGERFGRAAADALTRRRDRLIQRGLAERDGGAVRYRRNLLALLRSRELAAVGERLSRETGMTFVETRDGDRIDGVYRRPLRLASGKVAVIERGREFTLVPWKPVLERRLGQSVAGVMRGASVSFDLARKRGIGIG